MLRRFEEYQFPRLGSAVPFRELSQEETDFLTGSGCFSTSWEKVLITGRTDLSLIRRCSFIGKVNIDLPSGELTGSCIQDCVISGPLIIRDTGLVSGYSLARGSLIEYCGSIRWEGSSFLKGIIQGGVETGERDIPLIPVMDHNDAAWLASAMGRKDCTAATGILAEKLKGASGFIGEGAVLRSCSFISDSIFMKGSSAENAGSLRGSLFMAGASVSDGAVVIHSVIQWNGKVSTLAVVDSSILGECSAAEKQGRMSCSFLGADSVLGGGEITASIAGPLTGMHHQSLLIAALWPEGRGNVGYGANVGSNHTSRLPDQEIRPGAGVFFGLGCSVKFPADLSGSPYSVVATGVTTLPQKVAFPFSLILPGDDAPEGTPPGWSRLIPGWMLRCNLYSVLRNQWKYRRRSRSLHTSVETDVFTPVVLEMVKQSLKDLEGSVPDRAGCCFILEKDRSEGITTYRRCLRFFQLTDLMKQGELDSSGAAELLDLAEQVYSSVLTSRARDLNRGSRVISDYAEVRRLSPDDPFLEMMTTETDRFISEVNKFI